MTTRRSFLMQAAVVPLFSGAEVEGWTIVDGPDSSFTVRGGEITVADFASFPTWLRSGREYENFELRAEFFIKGWTDSGIYLRAPEHGHPTDAGFQIKVFHQKEEPATPYSVGSVFPVVAPKSTPVRDGWNELRVIFDGPRLQVYINGTGVQDLDVEKTPGLEGRLRRGYLGIVAASTPCRFRNLRVRELAAGEPWLDLYEDPADYEAHWTITEGKPNFVLLGKVLRGDGVGYIRTLDKVRDFEVQMYVRAAPQHNGGVIFRSVGRGRTPQTGYEIQLHSAEESHFPTGSLYHLKRARYPRIEDGKWYLLQLYVKDRYARVRINGETVMEYSTLDNLEAGYIELQAHRQGYWTEYKHIRMRKL